MYVPCVTKVLQAFAAGKKSHVLSRYLACRKRFERGGGSAMSEELMNELVVNEFEKLWEDPDKQLCMLPGKEALAAVNEHLQNSKQD